MRTVTHCTYMMFQKPIDFIDTCMDIVLEYKCRDDFENALLCPVNSNRDGTMKTFVEHILKTKVQQAYKFHLNKVSSQNSKFLFFFFFHRVLMCS